MHIRGECRYNNAAASTMESLVKRCSDCAFTRRMSGSFRIGGIGHHQENPFVPQLRETAEIRHLAVNRRVVELEVTRMDNHAHRCLDGKPHRIGNGMVHTDKAHAETAHIDNVPLHYRMQIARIHTIFLETAFQNAQRQTRAIDRHIELFKDIGQGTDMVFVPVGQDNRLNHIAILQKIADIRNNEVHAQHIFFGEHEPGINHENFIANPDDRHVLADLPQSAQGNNL